MAGEPKYQRRGEDERRRAFIEAALACLADHGVHGTTVRRIADRAGVAPGLLTHYFTGKDALVAEACRTLAGHILDEVAGSPAPGGNALERLRGFIRASFREPNLDPGLLRVWIGFWSLVLTDETARATHAETYARYRSTLEALLSDALAEAGRPVDAARTSRLAIAVSALLDGLWLEWCLDPSVITAREGERIALDAVAAITGLPLGE